MISFDVLSPHTEVVGNYFLEASAGTGKTFTIEHLVVRLLLETELSLSEILVVTFTRAATSELKVRIKKALSKALLYRNKLKNREFGKEGPQNFRSERATIAERQGASENGNSEVNLTMPKTDSSAYFGIEEPCFEYLKNLSEGGQKKIQRALETFEEAQIFTIHGFCHRMLQEFAFEAGVCLQLQEWTALSEREALIDFMRCGIFDLSAAQLQILLSSFQQDIEKLAQKVLKAGAGAPTLSFQGALKAFNERLKNLGPLPLTLLFQEALPHYKKMTDPRFPSQAAQLEALLKAGFATAEEFDTLLKGDGYFLHGLESSNLKVRSQSFVLDPRVVRCRTDLLPLIEAASDSEQIFRQFAFEWSQEKKKIQQKREFVTPDLLLEKMQQALGSQPFVSSVQKRYRAAIIDEFQDTDPIQWNIFETLFFSTEMTAVYLVGDPKQSIYSFRSADIYTYLKAFEKFDPSKRASLTTNFRSERGLVEKLNHLFGKTAWLDLPALNKSLSVHPVAAAIEGEGELVFFTAQAHLGKEKKMPSEEMEENYFFPYIVHEMARLNMTPDQVAILVKDRYQAARIQAFLEKWNYPASLVRGVSLADSVALGALEELIEDVVSLEPKKSLVGPLIGLCIEELTPETLLAARLIFKKLQTTLYERGFAFFFREFLKIYPLKNRAIEADIYQVVEKILSQGEHLPTLSLLQEIRKTETQERVVAQPQGIQILTIHASKGLEFENVFALGLASRHNQSAENRAEADAEKMRQLYVALTRARKRVYVPRVIDLDAKEPPLGTASPVELFWKKVEPDPEHFHTVDLNNTALSPKFYKPPKIEPPSQKRPLPRFVKPEFLSSFSSLVTRTYHSLAPLEGILPTGSETGVIIHRIFERSLFSLGSIAEIVEEETQGTELSAWREQICEMIRQTLALPLGNFCLQEIEESRTLQESEFTFEFNGSLIKGFIDLWFEKEGLYYLVDWKTNWLPSYDLPALEKAMEEGGYYLQAAIYTKALEKYLASFDPRPFKECFGGAFYLFVRGPKAIHFMPGERYHGF